jgi:hypothetical protein
MITCDILADEGIAVVKPAGPLSENDFADITKTIDAYLESHQALNGLLISIREFPGWEDFSGFIHHVKFVKDHHRLIKKVALVTDSKVASLAPLLAGHFVSAEVKSFDADAYNDALNWLQSS